MAYGRPVVATPVGGLVDAIEDGVTGLLARPDELRPALDRLLADPGLRARLGAAAREAISAQAGGEALVSLYEHNVPRG
jgi:type III pantothenate kinase